MALIALAVLQINDPDPVLWVTVYVVAAAVPIGWGLGRRMPVVFGVAMGMLLACLLMSAPGLIDYLKSDDYASIGLSMSPDRPQVESAREFGGALIAALIVLGFARWHIRGPRPGDKR
ncbi:MAG: transmembrane 220 family protein [Planctomycetota bacterium]